MKPPVPAPDPDLVLGPRHFLRPHSAFVVFSPRVETPLARLLPGPWKHCLALFPAADTGWILLDPRRGRTEVSHLSLRGGNVLLRRLAARGCSLEAVSLSPKARARRLPLFSCVEQMRRVLGVRGLCLTPVGLKRCLRSRCLL